MPRIQLTDIAVRALKADGQTDYWDTKTPGFGVRVGKNSKTFVAKVGNHRFTIGSYPELSLADARKKALGIKADNDPNAESIKFERALALYLEHSKANKRPRVASERERILTKHFLPVFKGRNVDMITDREIGKVIDGLKPVRSAANHAFKEARTFFRWCAKPPRRFVRFAPTTGMEMPFKEKRRERVLSDGEIESVWGATERVGYPFGTIVRMLLLTGQRRSEIANLQRPWINERERLITLPSWLTKNSVEHVFPYGDMFAELLETCPRFNDTLLLFPADGRHERPFSGWSKSKKRFELQPPIRPWTLHDLRRTFSTKLGELDVPQRVNDRLLNHISQGEITPLGKVYNLANYLPQARQAVSKYEAHLTHVLARAA